MRAAPVGECTCAGFREDLCPHCQEMNLWAYELLYGSEDDCDLRADELDWNDAEEEA